MSGRFFVLNSGRAGSKTVAKVLSQSSGCRCLHEPEPRLVAEATRYRYGEVEHDVVVDLLRRTRTEDRDVLRGETNNKLALLVPALHDAFADAKYVWLVRDGRDTVASMVQRGWYAPSEDDERASAWQRWRPQGDRLGVSAAAWASWDQFERVCWAWAWVNGLIEEDLAAVGQDRSTTVRLEELGAALPGLADFLGLEPFAATIDRANRRSTDERAADNRTNVVGRVETWQDWDERQREVFTRHAGALMDRHYTAWRGADEWRATAQEVVGQDRVAIQVAAPGTGTVVTDDLSGLRADLAELQLLRGDVRQLAHLYTQLAADDSARADDLARQLVEVRGELAAAEVDAARREVREVELDAALVEARAELSTANERAEAATEEADLERRNLAEQRKVVKDLRRRVEDLETSTSFRLGHAVVRSVARPGRTARRSARRAVLTANRRLTHDRRAALLQSAESALPAPAFAALKALITDAKTSSVAARTAVGAEGQPPASSTPLVADDVLLWVVLGLTSDQCARVVRRVAEVARLRADHTPFVLTDGDVASVLRRHAVGFELVPPRAAWQSHRRDVAWFEMVALRLAQVRAEQRPAQVVEVLSDGTDLSQLLAVLPPVRTR